MGCTAVIILVEAHTGGNLLLAWLERVQTPDLLVPLGLAILMLFWLLLSVTSKSDSTETTADSSQGLPASCRSFPGSLEQPSAQVNPGGDLTTELLAFENRMLREFLAEPRIDRSLDRLLESLCPHPHRDWAVLLEILHQQVRVRTSRGVSSPTMGKLSTDRSLWGELSSALPQTLEGAPLHHSLLFRSLTESEQASTSKIYLLRGQAAPGHGCLLITSTLFGLSSSSPRHLEIAEHLVELASRQMGEWRSQESSSAEVKLLRSMLELRSMVHGRKRTSRESLESLLHGLARLCGFQHAAIYSVKANLTDSVRVAFRSAFPAEPMTAEAWMRLEDSMVRSCMATPETRILYKDELRVLEESPAFDAAAVIPLWRRSAVRGILVLARCETPESRAIDPLLLDWAGDTVQEVLFQTIDLIALEQQAVRDALTGLANRHAFNEELDRVDQRLRQGLLSVCSLVLIDIDRFKAINDQYGHLAGDQVLREVSQAIQECVEQTRMSDEFLVARFGGEELTVLLPGLCSEGATRIAESIRTVARDITVEVDDVQLRVTVSAGVATIDRSASTQELIRRSDLALYQAKHQGRDRVVTYEQSSSSVVAEPADTLHAVLPS